MKTYGYKENLNKAKEHEKEIPPEIARTHWNNTLTINWVAVNPKYNSDPGDIQAQLKKHK